METQSPIQHLAADDKGGEALQQNNQKGSAGSAKSTGNFWGRPRSQHLFVCNLRTVISVPRTTYLMSSAKLVALLKDVFRRNEACFIIDDLVKGQANGSKPGYTGIGAKPTAQ